MAHFEMTPTAVDIPRLLLQVRDAVQIRFGPRRVQRLRLSVTPHMFPENTINSTDNSFVHFLSRGACVWLLFVFDRTEGGKVPPSPAWPYRELRHSSHSGGALVAEDSGDILSSLGESGPMYSSSSGGQRQDGSCQRLTSLKAIEFFWAEF